MAHPGRAAAGGEADLRVLHLVQHLALGGIERLVERLAIAAPEWGLLAEVAAYLGDGPLGERLEAAGVPVHRVATRAGLAPALPLRLARLVRQRRVDVLHTHHLGPFLYGGAAARLAGVAHVHTEHSVELYDRRRRRLLGRAMPYVAHVACVAPEVAAWRRERFGERPLVVPNGVRVPPPAGAAEVAAARAALGVPADAFVVGCVARLSPEKDHATLLAAFARLAAARPEARLLLVGDGPSREAIAARAAAPDLAGRVRLLGARLDGDELAVAFDVGALASTREGLPLALLEVLARGRPVVATAVGGVPGLLAGGGGVTVPPRDPAAFAAALEAYAASPARRAADGEAGRRLVAREHGSEAMERAYADLYRAAVARRRGR